MLEHIINLKPTVDNKTPTSFLIKRNNRQSGSLINTTSISPIDPLNQSKELSKSTLKMSKPAKER